MLLYPFVLLTTIIHEGGHALMALLTGGSVLSIGISPDGSGLTVSSGGIPGLVYMAGYLGATLFGAVALHVGRRKGMGKRSLQLMGALILGVSILWIHPWSSPFGFAAGLVIAGLLFLTARFTSERVSHFMSSFLAVQVSLNAFYGLRTLLYATTQTRLDNDAVFMSQLVHLPSWFWAGLWAVIAAGILAASLKIYWRESR